MNGKVYINSICDRCAHIDVCDSHKDNRQKCGCYLEQRPHGEWVLDKEISFIFNIYECSKCRFDGSKRWHFCPNCGASMISSNSEIEKSKSEMEEGDEK